MKLVKDVISALGQIASPNDVHSFAASAFRGTRGLIVHPHNRANPPRPEKPLELYEFEACPFCRKVREALCELDLAFINRTCAKGDAVKRKVVIEEGGKALFPYLVDPNNDVKLYESEDIITYLYETYGPGRSALSCATAPINTGFSGVASIVRPRGGRVRPGFESREQPPELLTLYNLESSPYCRKVRERLNELNLDYHVENVGKFSLRRPELVARGGKMMIPYLIDPNTDAEMYESDAILAYLDETYGAA